MPRKKAGSRMPRLEDMQDMPDRPKVVPTCSARPRKLSYIHVGHGSAVRHTGG
jgi:hypothetical protein